jgi:hypothetical protein
LAFEKKLKRGEMELKAVVICTAVFCAELGHASGNVGKMKSAGVVSCAKPAIPGETSLMTMSIFDRFESAPSLVVKRPREMASATSIEALERLIRT